VVQAAIDDHDAFVRYHVVILGTDEEVYLRRAYLTRSAAAAPAMAFSYSLLSRGRDTVRAANGGDAESQAEYLGDFYLASARRLDILQGTSADDGVVAARWAKTLNFLEKAAEQSIKEAQAMCGQIYANGDRSVPQNWTTAVKWWRKAAVAGQDLAQRYMGLCYYYGRGVDRDVAQAMVCFRKAAAQGDPAVVAAVQSGVPGHPAVWEVLARFTNAGSTAPQRHAAAHGFAGIVKEHFLGLYLQAYDQLLHEVDSAAPHQSVHDSLWLDFMLSFGLSAEELELAKRVHAYARSAAPTPHRSGTARCAWRCTTASPTTANTRPGTISPRRSRTRCCVPASSCAGARGGTSDRVTHVTHAGHSRVPSRPPLKIPLALCPRRKTLGLSARLSLPSTSLRLHYSLQTMGRIF
jgi:TPR repeat protein